MVIDEFLKFIDTNIYNFIVEVEPEPGFDPIADSCESQAFMRKLKFVKSVPKLYWFSDF